MKYPPNYLNVQQGSMEWFEARCGCVTASQVADAIDRLKNGGSSAKREKYKWELLTEIITGRAVEHYVSPYMDDGTEFEPLARAQYELAKGIEVERIGHIKHPGIERSGCSPDGLVGTEGLVEIKVPKSTTHVKYLVEGVVPEDYRPQMYWQMACAQRDWCDFVSYDPRVPEEFQLFICRLKWDEDTIRKMEQEVELFISEVNIMAGKLLKHKEAMAKPAGPGVERAEIPEFK